MGSGLGRDEIRAESLQRPAKVRDVVAEAREDSLERDAVVKQFANWSDIAQLEAIRPLAASFSFRRRSSSSARAASAPIDDDNSVSDL